MVNKDRNILFGKYKGTPMKKLILEHPGYIMWCLTNLSWFRLNKDEQAVYDATSLAANKSKCPFTFPAIELLKHVKDDRYTPFVIDDNGGVFFKKEDREHPVVKSVWPFVTLGEMPYRGTGSLGGFTHVLNKEFDIYGEDYEDISENPHWIVE